MLLVSVYVKDCCKTSPLPHQAMEIFVPANSQRESMIHVDCNVNHLLSGIQDLIIFMGVESNG